MSNHHILAAVSRRIRRILWEGIKEDEATRSLIKSGQAIRISPPDLDSPDGRLFLWLYQVRPNLYLADQPVRRITDVAEPTPLPLDLFYMLAPMLPAGDQDGADLVILARTMQIMAANDHIVLDEPGFEEALRVILEDPPMVEQVALWRALQTPLRIAAFYQVNTVRVDPLAAV